MATARAEAGSTRTALLDVCNYIELSSKAMTGQDRKLTRQFKISVWRTLMEVHEAVLREIERELADRHQMTVREFDALVNIPRAGVPLRELTERVVLSQSATSRLIDRLVRRGWVEREGVAGDSRAVHICLTETGRKATRRAARTNAEVVERVFADRVAPKELEMLNTVLTRLHGDLGVWDWR